VRPSPHTPRQKGASEGEKGKAGLTHFSKLSDFKLAVEALGGQCLQEMLYLLSEMPFCGTRPLIQICVAVPAG
jgi:hypothetical protein